jgi:hypothetical protein
MRTNDREMRDALLAIATPFLPAVAMAGVLLLAKLTPALLAGLHLIVPVAVLLLATVAIIGIAVRLIGELGLPETDAAIGR